MKIEFEWHTRGIDTPQKDKLEKEIMQEVSKRLEELARRKIEALVVSLYDDETRDDFSVRGEVFSAEKGMKKAKFCKIRINQGFLIECEKLAWFQPSKA